MGTFDQSSALFTLLLTSPSNSFTGTYAIATVTAPLIGGAFTDSLTWRWLVKLVNN
jgi:hypothetical protein